MSSANGKPPKRPAAERLQEAQTEFRALLAERNLRRLKESAAVDYDWVGAWGELLQQRSAEPGWFPVGSPSSRRHGHYFPFFQSEQQLGLLRDLSRIQVGTNNHAAGMLNGLTSFVIGTGYTFKLTPVGPNGKAMRDKLTDFLDEWSAEVEWDDFQQEAFSRHLEDGDELIRMFPDDGLMKIRHYWPEQLTQPPGTAVEDWGYGVRAARDDAARVEAYWFGNMNQLSQGEEVPAGEVVHMKTSRTGIKRGLPYFSFGTKDVFDSAGRLTRNLGEGSAVRAAIAFMREHEAATQGDIELFADSQADYRERRPFRDNLQGVGKVDPGTVIDFPQGMKHVPPPEDPATAAHAAVVQLLLRSGGQKDNAPEWLVSGDASNMGAYTSSLVAESPFVRGVTRRQNYYRTRFLRIVRAAIRVAVAHGILPPEVEAAVKVDLVPPTAEVRNKLEEAQRFAVERPLGVDSPQRYCESQDRDFDTISRENREYDEQHPPPGGGGGGAGVRTREGLLEAKDASGHEHAADGKFGTGGGGSSWEKYQKVKGPAKERAAAPKTEPQAGTLADGTVVHFVPHPSAAGGGYETVLVDAAALDAAWAKDEGYYVPPGGGGAEIPGRRERFGRFLATGQPVEAPKAVLSGDAVAVDDGRHRLSVLRDKGVDRVAVTVPAEQAGDFRARFGAPRQESLLESVLREHGVTGTFTDSLGRERHYVDGRQVAAPPAASAGRQGGGAHAGTHPADRGPPSADAVDVAGALGEGSPPGLVAKVKARVARALTRVARLAYDAALASPQVLDALGMVADTPDDMKKIGYNPATAGTEAHHVPDAKDFGSPLTTYQVMNVAVKVLPAALAWVRSKLAGRKPEALHEAEQPTAAEVLHGLLAVIAEEFGLPAPSAEQLAAKLAALTGGAK